MEPTSFQIRCLMRNFVDVLCIQEVTGCASTPSDLITVFHGFPQLLQLNAWLLLELTTAIYYPRLHQFAAQDRDPLARVTQFLKQYVPFFEKCHMQPFSVLVVYQFLPEYIKSAGGFKDSYCPRQFTWRLHSAVSSQCLVTSWFTWRTAKQVVSRSDYVLRGGVRAIVARARSSCCMYNGEMLFWTAVLNAASAEHVIINSHSVRNQDKWLQ